MEDEIFPSYLRHTPQCDSWFNDEWGYTHRCNKAQDHRPDVPHGDGQTWWWGDG